MDWKKPLLDMDEIDRRKRRIRDAWLYRRVDKMPLYVMTSGDYQNPNKYTPEEIRSDVSKQFELAMRVVAHDLVFFDDDYVPVVRGVNETTYFVAEHFGCRLGENMRVISHPLTSVADVQAVEAKAPTDNPRVHRILETLRYFALNVPPGIGICDFDSLSPMCTASQLLETDLYYTIQYDDPETLLHLLQILEDYYVGYFREVVSAVGGIDRMPSVDGDWLWHPSPYKALIDCDVLAMMNKDSYLRYQQPFVDRMCGEFGGGVVHCCGKQPYPETRVAPEKGLMGIHMCWELSHQDNAAIKKALAHKGVVIYFTMFGVADLPERLEVYRKMADYYAPDVVCIPVFDFNLDRHSETEVREFYREATAISQQYASRMDWE